MTTSKIYVNHGASKVDGTHLQGYVHTTKRDLKSLLGKPLFEDFMAYDKVLTEWVLEFKDGLVATIYDWKLDEALRMDDNYEWHIGGHKKEVVERVQDLITGDTEYEIKNEKRR